MFLEIWDSVLGANLADPGPLILLSFIVFFVISPIITLWLAIKMVCWLAESYRRWWKSDLE